MTPVETAARVKDEAERLRRRATCAVEDAMDEAIYRVKRRPAAAMALAFGAGTLAGIVVAWLCREERA